MSRFLLRTVAALVVVVGLAATAFAQHSVTYWPDNKAAAVSLTFDDGYASQLTLVVPQLDSHGVKGTFFIITNDATTNGLWDSWRAVAAAGHEIGSHTLDHPYLTQLSASAVDTELKQSQAVINAQITSQKCITFAYPYGDQNSTVQAAAAKYYLAARGVTWDVNYAPYPFYLLEARGDDPSSTVSGMTATVDQAISAGAWMISYMHDLAGQYYGVWTPSMLGSYLDALMTRNVWIAPMGAVVKFTRERDSSTLSVVSSTSSQIVLNLHDTLDNTVYNQPLTLRSQVPSTWTTVNVLQNGSNVQVATVLESGVRVAYYHAVPDLGTITLTSGTVPMPSLSGVSLSPTSVVAASPSTGTVTLSSVAPPGGVVVTLTSSNTSVATVPTSVTVPASSTSATFTVSTAARTTTATSTITATFNGTSKTATLTVTPLTLTSVGVSPTSVTGGSVAAGTATLTGPAPSGGVVVTLTSSNTSAATVPASVTVPAGASAGLFTVTTLAVGSTATSTITATYSGTSRTTTLTVTSSPSPVITTSALAVGTVGVAYSQTLAATGGMTPYSWSATGVPSGLSLSTAGVLSGTPTAAGTFTVAITVTDAAARTASTSLSLTVGTTPPPTSLAIDVTAYGDGDGSGTAAITTSTLTTTAANELLVAFIGSADGSAGNVTVSGLGLTWAMAVSKAGNGDTEIWWAYATGTVSGTVTATITQNCSRSLTVVAFKGTAVGADAIGATAGVARTGAPTASLVTTRANSWVFATGNEYLGCPHCDRRVEPDTGSAVSVHRHRGHLLGAAPDQRDRGGRNDRHGQRHRPEGGREPESHRDSAGYRDGGVEQREREPDERGGWRLGDRHRHPQ